MLGYYSALRYSSFACMLTSLQGAPQHGECPEALLRNQHHSCGAHAQVHMAAGDHAGLIEACARLGDVSRGGDPHLWTEVLQYFGSQQYDCTPQVEPLALPRAPFCAGTADLLAF